MTACRTCTGRDMYTGRNRAAYGCVREEGGREVYRYTMVSVCMQGGGPWASWALSRPRYASEGGRRREGRLLASLCQWGRKEEEKTLGLVMPVGGGRRGEDSWPRYASQGREKEEGRLLVSLCHSEEKGRGEDSGPRVLPSSLS